MTPHAPPHAEATAAETPAATEATTPDERLAAVEEYLRETVTVAAWAAQQVEALTTRTAGLEATLTQLSGVVALQQRELGQLRPQIAALEEREGRRSAPVVLHPPSEAELAEARSLVDEVRAEHERVRARVGLASSYEERLRRLESRR